MRKEFIKLTRFVKTKPLKFKPKSSLTDSLLTKVVLKVLGTNDDKNKKVQLTVTNYKESSLW